MTEITQILERIQAGENGATDALLGEVYDELRRVAAAKLAKEAPGQTLQATALVHEAWLKIAGEDGPQFENRRHFFGAAAEAMRRILVERARRRSRQRRGGDLERSSRDLDVIAAGVPEDRILAVHEALDALEAVDPLKAKLVKLKYFVGLENAETAEALDISVSSVERYWVYCKAWLMKEMRRSSTASEKNQVS